MGWGWSGAEGRGAGDEGLDGGELGRIPFHVAVVVDGDWFLERGRVGKCLAVGRTAARVVLSYGLRRENYHGGVVRQRGTAKGDRYSPLHRVCLGLPGDLPIKPSLIHEDNPTFFAMLLGMATTALAPAQDLNAIEGMVMVRRKH